MARLGDLVVVQAKSKIKAGDGLLEGKYRFFTSSNIQSKWLNKYQYNKPALIFGTGGMPSIHYCDTPFSTSTDCVVMYGRSEIELLTIYCYLDSNIHLLSAGFHGIGLQHISPNYILNIDIPAVNIVVQKRIADLTNIMNRIILLRKQQLYKLNELIKSQFIEMFDIINTNKYRFPIVTLKDVCKKITDGKHGGCKQESNSGYYFVGAREIFDGSIHYETAPQITYDDFVKDYKRCNIECGDFVLVNTGATIGKSAVATNPLTTKTLLQKSVALFKVMENIIDPYFLQYCYLVNPHMYLVENASAQPNLLLSKINATKIYLPPIELQKEFTAFVTEIKKQKLTIQQSLDKLELLKKSLMQEYFG